MSHSESSPSVVSVTSPARKVSVVIPAYNAAAYVGDALASVFAQTFTDFEVIVINDGSPDTPELERVLEEYRPRITYLKQENRGAAAARNTGLKHAVGDYVGFLDADDVWHADYLKEQLKFIEDSKVDLVYCDALLIGDSRLVGRRYMEISPSTGLVTPESLLGLRCNVITSGVLVRRDLVIRVGMFDEAIRRGHDFDLWLRLAKHGAKLSYQRKVLLTHRILQSGLSGDSVSQQERGLSVLGTLEQRITLTNSEQQTLRKTLERMKAGLNLEKGKVYLLNRDFEAAAQHMETANRYYRGWKLRAVLLGLRLAPNLVWRFYRRRETF